MGMILIHREGAEHVKRDVNPPDVLPDAQTTAAWSTSKPRPSAHRRAHSLTLPFLSCFCRISSYNPKHHQVQTITIKNKLTTRKVLSPSQQMQPPKSPSAKAELNSLVALLLTTKGHPGAKLIGSHVPVIAHGSQPRNNFWRSNLNCSTLDSK